MSLFFIRLTLSFLDSCPSGYEDLIGDVPGFGSDLGGNLDLTKDQCALKCDEIDDCLSFEHSKIERKCHLNRISEPVDNQVRDWIFCKKGK